MSGLHKGGSVRWLPLESNPDNLNTYISNMGVEQGVFTFQDVLSTDEWAIDMIRDWILYFPINEACSASLGWQDSCCVYLLYKRAEARSARSAVFYGSARFCWNLLRFEALCNASQHLRICKAQNLLQNFLSCFLLYSALLCSALL
jgi:hypothetical protein